MTEHVRKSGAAWGAVGWGVGVLALLVALPLAASGRLPDRLATHWEAGSGRPDDSMPLWAAALFPALIWGVLAVVVVLTLRRAGAGRGVPGWAAAGLGFGGVTLLGGQASVVRTNLDRTDWHDAGSVTSGVVGTLVVAAAAGAAGLLAARRAPSEPRPAADGPTLDLPAGQRVVWLARTSNSWLQAIAALTGLLAITVFVSSLAGLTDLPFLLAATPFTLASVLVLGCSSVLAVLPRPSGHGEWMAAPFHRDPSRLRGVQRLHRDLHPRRRRPDHLDPDPADRLRGRRRLPPLALAAQPTAGRARIPAPQPVGAARDQRDRCGTRPDGGALLPVVQTKAT
ncbi:DUF1648 domain-containing protein [Streptomyces avermitilis]